MEKETSKPGVHILIYNWFLSVGLTFWISSYQFESLVQVFRNAGFMFKDYELMMFPVVECLLLYGFISLCSSIVIGNSHRWFKHDEPFKDRVVTLVYGVGLIGYFLTKHILFFVVKLEGATNAFFPIIFAVLTMIVCLLASVLFGWVAAFAVVVIADLSNSKKEKSEHGESIEKKPINRTITHTAKEKGAPAMQLAYGKATEFQKQVARLNGKLRSYHQLEEYVEIEKRHRIQRNREKIQSSLFLFIQMQEEEPKQEARTVIREMMAEMEHALQEEIHDHHARILAEIKKQKSLIHTNEV